VENNPKTLTIDELTELTGFDRRTIAYYVQEGLLPKVGRRGRLTRYPQFIVDRLLFIKRLREAEETGERAMPMTLAEIRDVFETTAPELIADITTGEAPIDAITEIPPAGNESFDGLIPRALAEGADQPRTGPPDMVSRELRMNFMLQETEEPDLFVPGSAPDRMVVEDAIVHACEGPPAYGDRHETRLPASEDFSMDYCASGPPSPDSEKELSELLTHLSRTAGRTPHEPDTSETWTHVSISPGFKLAVRDLDGWETRLLEKLAKLLREKI